MSKAPAHRPEGTSSEGNGGSNHDRYSTDGGKLSFHGYSYQLKLLMLFMVRGLNNNFCFRLATEMRDAEKFDDVVFEGLKGANGGKRFRFLQAKHSAGETRGAISAHNLLLEAKGDFGLQKYFQSYLKIRENPKFSGEDDEVKDLILFTNKGFKFRDRICDFELREEIFEKERTEDGGEKLDDILQTGLLRFKDDFEGKSFLVSHLKNAFVKLPKVFAERVLQDETFDFERCESILFDKTFESYREALVGEVVDVDAEVFRPSFVDAEGLSPEATHFRDVLRSECFSRHHCHEDDFRAEMKKRKIKVSGRQKGADHRIDSPAKVAEKLAGLMRKNAESRFARVTDSNSLIARNMVALSGRVFIKDEKGVIRFNQMFVSGDEFSGNVDDFRKSLEFELKKRKIDFAEIARYSFEIANFVDRPAAEGGSSIAGAVDAFLKRLAFAVEQPSEVELDEIIKSELLKEFKASEAENVYGRFLVKTFDWMKDKVGKYFSHEEGRVFFEQIKKEMLASIWFEVKNPATNFTGREKELVSLHDAIRGVNNDRSAAVITQSVSISGLGGVGKTELAKQYAFLHSGEYDNIIWINAESNATIGNSFRKLAFDKLGIREENVNGKVKSLDAIVDEVYDFLRGKNSLFIFDNAEKMRMETEGDSGIQSFLPKFPVESKHYTLITSRNQNWGDLKKVKLETFTENEAVELIGKSIDLNKGSKESQAKDLAKALQCYPLALQQAIAYIKASDEEKVILGQNYTISDYLHSLQVMSRKLLDFPFQSDSNDSYTKGTYTTWKITLDDIKDKKHGKLAVDILNLISYFSPDDISIENISSILNEEENSDLIPSLMFLKQYSMIGVENGKASVHRLVQLITRLRLSEEGKEVEILWRLLRAGEKLDAEHAVSVWDFSCKYVSLVEEFSYLPSHIVELLSNNFKLKEAYSFAERSVKVLEKELGENHQRSLSTKQAMARVLDGLGNYEQALKTYEDIYEKIQSTLSDEHPKALKIKNYIANMLNNLGKYDDALKSYQEVYKKICIHYGEDHPDTLHIKHNIAIVLFNLGEHGEALKSYQNVYEKLRVSLGEDHQKTLNVKHNIANVLDKLGKHDMALNCYQEVYEKYKVTLDKDHPTTLATKHNIASVLEKLGKHSDALEVYQEVYEKSRNILGEYHPDTIDTKYSISYVLYKLDEYDKALTSYQEVYEKFNNTFGENHEKTLHSKYCIANVLYNLGNYSEALNCYNEVHVKMVELFGKEHPKILQTKQCIANTLYNLGKHDKALQLYREINEQVRTEFGKDHARTISSKQFMANVLFKLGKHQEAYEMYKNVYQKMLIDHGEFHEKTLTAKHNVASALNKLGKHSESLKYYEDVYEKQITVLGEEHPSTLLTRNNMSMMWHKIQKQNEGSHSNQENKEENDMFSNDDHSIETKTKEDDLNSVPDPTINQSSCENFVKCLCLIRLSQTCNIL